MGNRKIQFGEDQYYHVFNRGVDKRNVFLDAEDFDRFFESMRDFNATEAIGSLYEFRFKRGSLLEEYGPPDPLVHVVAYCLNPNHYHFILKQVVDKGVEQFMQRLGTGYTMYFNKKYKRSGALFQGRFKAAHITSDEYLLHVSAYVNLNHRVHKLGGSTSKSSWKEYVDGVEDGHADAMCKKGIILQQFRNLKEYKQFAEQALVRIRERKDLEKMLF